MVKIDSEQKPTWVEANYVDDVPKYIASRALAGRLVAAYGAAEGFSKYIKLTGHPPFPPLSLTLTHTYVSHHPAHCTHHFFNAII